MLNIEQTDQLIRDMSTYVDKTADSVTYGEMVQIVSAYVAPDDDYRSVDDDQYKSVHVNDISDISMSRLSKYIKTSKKAKNVKPEVDTPKK